MGRGGAPPPNIALKRHTDLYTYKIIYVCIIVSDPAFMQIHVMLLSDRNAASPRLSLVDEDETASVFY